MPLRKKIERFTLALAVIWAGYFLVIHEIETSVFMIGLWLLNRPIVSVIDVFFTAFAGYPMVQVNTAKQRNVTQAQAASGTEKLSPGAVFLVDANVVAGSGDLNGQTSEQFLRDFRDLWECEKSLKYQGEKLPKCQGEKSPKYRRVRLNNYHVGNPKSQVAPQLRLLAS